MFKWLMQFVFEDLSFFEYGIEIVKYQHPLFEPIFDEEDTEDSPILIKDVYKQHLTTMSKGLQLVKQYNPDFFRMLLKCRRKIMLFTAKLPYSFATLSIHNMIFMNVNTWDTEIFFVDHFSHEGAQVIFFTFHGLFTFQEIARSLAPACTILPSNLMISVTRYSQKRINKQFHYDKEPVFFVHLIDPDCFCERTT